MNLLKFVQDINITPPEIFVSEDTLSISENGEARIIPGNYKVWKAFISKTQPIVYLQLYVNVKVEIPENKDLDIQSEQICSCLITLPIINLKSGKSLMIAGLNSIENIELTDKSNNLKLDNFFSLISNQLNLKAENKVIKYFIDKNSQKIEKSTELNEKLEYLKFYNIVDGRYLPKGSGSEKYENIINISIKGFSNLPSVNEVLKRKVENKAQTIAGELMKKYVDIYENYDVNKLIDLNKSIESQLESIDTIISYQSFLYRYDKTMPEGCDGKLVYEQDTITIKFNI